MTDDEARKRRLHHDLRSPLAIVLGYADLLAREEPVDESTRREYAQHICAAAREMRDLLDADR